MLSSDVLELLLWMIIFVVSLMLVVIVVTASLQQGNEYINDKNYKNKRRRRRNKLRKKKKQESKAAPTSLRLLMQPEHIVHFENFVILLEKINWPEYPMNSSEKDGVEKSASIDELEDYEDELEEANEQEDYLYDLYTNYLKSKGIHISQSELTYVVDLYQKNSKD